MDVVGYVRVSTEAQAEGMGPDVQRAGIRAFCAEHGHRVAFWCEDLAISGAKGLEGRPQLTVAFNILRTERTEGGSKEADALVVFRLDRLARDLVLQETLIAELRSIGASVHSCSPSENEILRDDAGDPSRKLIRQVLGAVSEYERAMIGLRMAAGKAAKKAAGGWVGGRPPYGYAAIGGELVPRADEQEILVGIWGLLDAGYSPRKVADELNARGLPARSSELWSYRTIESIRSLGRRPKAA